MNLTPSGLAIVAAAVSAGVVAAPAGWFAREGWLNIHDRPAIIHEQQAICTAEVQTAAAKATRDEQLRQFRIGEAATEQFIIEQKAADDMAAAERDRQEQEIVDYEHKLLEAGRVCALDGDDLDFLGVQLKPGTAPGGSGAGPGSGASRAAASTR